MYAEDARKDRVHLFLGRHPVLSLYEASFISLVHECQCGHCRLWEETGAVQPPLL